jgi:hypothetical protein
MRKMAFVLAAAALAVSSGAAPAAGENLAAVKRAQMRQLQIIAGQWEGTGWLIAPDGARREFRQRECIRPRVAGTVYLVEGFAWAKDAPPDAPSVFEAIMLIDYDPAAGAFTYRTHESVNGGGDEGTFAIRNNVVTWSHGAGPGSRMVYRIVLDGDTWHETGVYESEGRPESVVFEMKLERTAAVCSGF